MIHLQSIPFFTVASSVSAAQFPLAGGFILLVVGLWVFAFTLRMRAGRGSSRAVRKAAEYLDQINARNARIHELNQIFQQAVSGRSPVDQRALAEYLVEYSAYASNYRRDQEQARSLLENARYEMERLRVSQNMLGGANDLAAIPYYTRSSKLNKLIHRFNETGAPAFDVELVKQVRRLAQGGTRTV